jgi:hypothetical protein
MPVVSEPVSLPHTWRPLGVRIAAGALGAMLTFVVVFAWWSFDAETRASFTFFQVATLVALGVLAFGLGYALARSRVVAELDRLVVVNGYRRREFEYAAVVEAHLPPGAPWVTLDLDDGTTVSAMGIQGSDGARAQTALRQLRAVLASASAG